MSSQVDQLAADRLGQHRPGQSGSRRTPARQQATRSARAARSTAPGRSSELDVAAWPVWFVVLPTALDSQVRGAVRRVPFLAGVALCRIRWAKDMARRLTANLVQFPRGLASRECARAGPAPAPARTASPDPRRRSKTCRKGTWAATTRAVSGVRPSRRAFVTQTAENPDTGRVLPQSPSPGGTRSCPSHNCEANVSNGAAA
jgi:hypothetical protein